jgi:hypothetical protein
MSIEEFRFGIWDTRIMPHIVGLAATAALLLAAVQASAESITFDFESGGDQGWGNAFSPDPTDTAMKPIDIIAGSNRMRITRTGGFQQASRRSFSTSEAYHLAMAAAAGNEANYLISYDYYIDTSGANDGTFLQLGTFVNTNMAGEYAQDFPGVGKDVELSGADLASGNIFSGTISETFTAKGYNLPTGRTDYELGLIINGNNTEPLNVWFDNISVRAIPEPASFALFALAAPAMLMLRRRR